MKHLLSIVTALFIQSGLIFAQTLAPGGVPNPKHWWIAEKQPHGTLIWLDKCSDSAPIATLAPGESSGCSLNFNPVWPLSDSTASGLDLPLAGDDFSRAAFFTIVQPTDSVSEKIIWNLEQNGHSQWVLTDARLTNLVSYEYTNFAFTQKGLPCLYAVTRCDKDANHSAQQQWLRVGKKPESPQLPVQKFTGNIPEIIAFDRVLNARERMQVSSYLALKYGLTLLNTDYFNSSGEVIWKIKENALYPANIAGLGRDDRSGLLVIESASSYNPGLMVMSVGQSDEVKDEEHTLLPADNIFLICSDNDAPLVFDEKQFGQPRMLRRKWKITTHNWLSKLPTVLQFDTRQLQTELPEGEIYWLAIDRSGTGQFPLGATEYYPATPTKQGIVSFDNLRWDVDGSGSDLFALGTGPSILAAAWLSLPLCSPPTNGILHLRAKGGRPPYQVELINLTNSFTQSWQTDNISDFDVTGIAAGDYVLKIRDAEAHLIQETFYVQSADAPLSPLADYYELPPFASLQLDASIAPSAAPVLYSWIGPGEFCSTSSQITISRPGLYRLEIDSAGCKSRQDIEVAKSALNNFASVVIRPNPVASGGRFEVEASLHHKADIEMLIHDTSGQLILHRTLRDIDYCKFSESLDTPGVYVVTLRSEGGQETLRLVVK
ncbi:MAG: T9SS type A sorting domain-containing protein [Saprospiraceae bacterium]|nr:T9SS type A sorting domain-containing protein [Saprospiraceae bacterium]MCB9306038.1 T9SS type A sorting domain-containing protein [Lewinellaceae bacterium]